MPDGLPPKYLQRQPRSCATIALERIFKRVDEHLFLAGDRVSVVLRTFTESLTSQVKF